MLWADDSVDAGGSGVLGLTTLEEEAESPPGFIKAQHRSQGAEAIVSAAAAARTLSAGG